MRFQHVGACKGRGSGWRWRARAAACSRDHGLGQLCRFPGPGAPVGYMEAWQRLQKRERRLGALPHPRPAGLAPGVGDVGQPQAWHPECFTIPAYRAGDSKKQKSKKQPSGRKGNLARRVLPSTCAFYIPEFIFVELLSSYVAKVTATLRSRFGAS